MSGYLYVLTNPSMPGYVKIGTSKYSGARRAAELYTTGVPVPFVLEFEIYCSEPRSVEKAVHERLDQYRCKGREFFRLDVAQAVNAVAGEALSEWELFCCGEFEVLSGDGCAELAYSVPECPHPMYMASALRFITPEAGAEALRKSEDHTARILEKNRGQD